MTIAVLLSPVDCGDVNSGCPDTGPRKGCDREKDAAFFDLLFNEVVKVNRWGTFWSVSPRNDLKKNRPVLFCPCAKPTARQLARGSHRAQCSGTGMGLCHDGQEDTNLPHCTTFYTADASAQMVQCCKLFPLSPSPGSYWQSHHSCWYLARCSPACATTMQQCH